jgi:hypothetical protein
MSYFNHAFCKAFAPLSLEAVAGEKTSTLGVQEIALVAADTWLSEDPTGAPAGNFHIVQGAYTTQDKIGNNPGHGGYAESIKSKMINPKYITKLYETTVLPGSAAEATLEVAPDCVPCGEAIFLRLDVKGAPALRFLNHNAYATVDSANICCTVDGQEYIDPAVALVAAVKNLTEDPIVSPFFQVKEIEILNNAGVQQATYASIAAFDAGHTTSTDPVTDEINVKVTLEGAYVDTKFGDCSFDTRDYYGKEPVKLILSALDETGDPCSDCGVATDTPGTILQTQGETVIRKVLLSERYRQSPYNQGNADSARIREIEGSDDVVAGIDRTDLYKSFVLEHVVPRFNNPSGVFDNDRYLYEIFVKDGNAVLIGNIRTLFTQIATVADVPFENGTGTGIDPIL